MKKEKGSYILTIPEPCHEQWNTMTPNEQGRFCHQCSKTIIDLTRLNDQQIIQLIKNTTSGVCGHVYSTQLNRPIEDLQLTLHRKFYPLPQLLSGLLLMGSPEYGIAQRDTVQTELTTAETKNLPFPPDTIYKHTVEGRLIIHALNEPISFCKIYLKDTCGNIIDTTHSDANGLFKIIVPPTTTEDIVVIEFIPRQMIRSKEIILNKNEDLPWKQEIELHPVEQIRSHSPEEIVVGTITVAETLFIPKRRWFRKRK